MSLAGWSLCYRPATHTNAVSGVAALSRSVASTRYFLVQGESNGGNGAPLPTPDIADTLNPSGGGCYGSGRQHRREVARTHGVRRQ